MNRTCARGLGSRCSDPLSYGGVRKTRYREVEHVVDSRGMSWTPDKNQARVATKPRKETDELVAFDVERYVTMEWDEDPAPGRPEMTGQWRIHYRDGTSDTIDLPLHNIDSAISQAKDLIAERLTQQ
jgi:hypothetical protein